MPISDYEGDTTGYRDKIYAILRGSFIDDGGDSTFSTEDASTTDEPNVSVFQALLWGVATGIAQAQEQLVRAGQNANPAEAVELLGMLEEDHRVVPSYGSTIPERQARLALRASVAKGSSRPAIEAALTEMLASAFVAYETIGDTRNDVVAYPTAPGDFGVFDAIDAERKIFRILDSVSRTNTQVTVRFEVLGDSNPPIAGEFYCFDPDPRKRIEKVQIVAVEGSTLTAVFGQAHEPNTIACRPHPVWNSNRRVNRIVLTQEAATDAETRQLVHDYLARTLRATSRWSIVGNAGSFQVGSATRALLSATSFDGSPPTPDTQVFAAGVAVSTSSAGAVGSSVMAGAAVGAASGSSTAAASGAATKGAVAAARGTSSCSATSTAQARSVGAASGTSINVAVGLRGPYGTAEGTSTASATGTATKSSVASASGLATCAGVGAAQIRSVGAAAGTSTAHGVKG